MTAKEKAKELIENFELYSFDEGEGGRVYDLEDTKIFALTCVNEIISDHLYLDFDLSEQDERVGFWRDVKEEIEKL
jgi:hypothetical protein